MHKVGVLTRLVAYKVGVLTRLVAQKYGANMIREGKVTLRLSACTNKHPREYKNTDVHSISLILFPTNTQGSAKTQMCIVYL